MASSAPALPERIVLFDGVCSFCDSAVDFAVSRDPAGRLHFAPLQGGTAAQLRARHPEIPEATETLVVVEREGGTERVHRDSAAIFRVLALLQSPWRHAALLRFLPRRLTDAGYRLFMRNRYRWFGRRDHCRLPAPDEAKRFLS